MRLEGGFSAPGVDGLVVVSLEESRAEVEQGAPGAGHSSRPCGAGNQRQDDTGRDAPGTEAGISGSFPVISLE